MQSKAQIDHVLRQKSDAKEIPGVVAMAATSKELIYQGAFGKRDLSKDDAMTARALKQYPVQLTYRQRPSE